jgi:hypothetical protein
MSHQKTRGVVHLGGGLEAEALTALPLLFSDIGVFARYPLNSGSLSR